MTAVDPVIECRARELWEADAATRGAVSPLGWRSRPIATKDEYRARAQREQDVRMSDGGER